MREGSRYCCHLTIAHLTLNSGVRDPICRIGSLLLHPKATPAAASPTSPAAASPCHPHPMHPLVALPLHPRGTPGCASCRALNRGRNRMQSCCASHRRRIVLHPLATPAAAASPRQPLLTASPCHPATPILCLLCAAGPLRPPRCPFCCASCRKTSLLCCAAAPLPAVPPLRTLHPLTT